MALLTLVIPEAPRYSLVSAADFSTCTNGSPTPKALDSSFYDILNPSIAPMASVGLDGGQIRFIGQMYPALQIQLSLKGTDKILEYKRSSALKN